jgi:hypothetical protein
MRFECSSCDQWHNTIPAWGWRIPFAYHAIPEGQRERRCYLTDDLCVVDDQQFLITGVLEIPVIGTSELVSLRVWVSVSRVDWFEYQDLFGQKSRSHFGPYTGRLDSTIPTYPDTFEMSVSLEIRDDGIRPLVHVAPSDHPLYGEQSSGMDVARVARLYRFFEHRDGDAYQAVAADRDTSARARRTCAISLCTCVALHTASRGR